MLSSYKTKCYNLKIMIINERECKNLEILTKSCKNYE
jgi:hypothetical protein